MEKGERFGIWCGLIGLFIFGPALMMAGFFPLPRPSLTPDEVVALYRDNTTGIRLAVVVSLYVAGLFIAFFSALASQMRRIPGARAYSYIQMTCGLTGIVPFILTALFWAGAAFRPDRSAETIVLLNDLSWFAFVMVAPPVMIQLIAIGIAILGDDRPQPLYPRWLAYLCFWTALAVIADPFTSMFTSGPFAWNGLLVFWVPFGVFATWLLVMIWAMFRAAKTA